MSTIRSLRIRLGEIEVGVLTALDDGRTYFSCSSGYIGLQDRPVLSMLYGGTTPAETEAILRDPQLAANRGEGGRLPPWFRGLLPEGVYRTQLIAAAGIAPDDEIALLSFCGKDLPGAVTAEPFNLEQHEIASFLTQGQDAYESASDQLPTPERASLSGIQPKSALWLNKAGRYVARGRFGASHFIGKMPGDSTPLMPEIEYASLCLAKAAGVRTCEFELLPQGRLDFDPPLDAQAAQQNFLLVHRFDRDGPQGARIHMEDMAQALGIDPLRKYQGSNAGIGLVLATAGRLDDLPEFLRRVKVNELLGNIDAHLKNTSLLYKDPQHPELAPAYDIVAYTAILPGRGVGLLNLPGDPTTKSLTPAVVRRLANLWGCNEKPLLEALKDAVDRAMTLWPKMIDTLPFPEGARRGLLKHLNGMPDVAHWYARHRDARPLLSEATSLPVDGTPGDDDPPPGVK